MRRFLFLFTILGVLCASCCCNYGDTTLYQRSGRQKAIVAVLPVIHHADDTHYCWDLSTEFTEEIRKLVFDSTKIYLLRDQGSLELAEKFNVANPAKIPAEEIKNLGAAEFVVVSELIDQKESPYGWKNDAEGAVVNLSMRVRVIDVRHETPKVILQEVLNNEQVISLGSSNSDYNKIPWGTVAFQRSPLGLAHQRIVRELVARVESYVEASR